MEGSYDTIDRKHTHALKQKLTKSNDLGMQTKISAYELTFHPYRQVFCFGRAMPAESI